MSDDSTLDVQRQLGGEQFLRTGLDLLVEQSGHAPRRVPICQRQTTLGGPASDVPLEGLAERQGLLRHQEGRLFFTNLAPHNESRLGDKPVTFCELTAHDCLTLGSVRLRLVPADESWRGALECYSEPYQGRSWGLGTEPTLIGRPGTRANRIELSDRTVSRARSEPIFIPRPNSALSSNREFCQAGP